MIKLSDEDAERIVRLLLTIQDVSLVDNAKDVIESINTQLKNQTNNKIKRYLYGLYLGATDKSLKTQYYALYRDFAYNVKSDSSE